MASGPKAPPSYGNEASNSAGQQKGYSPSQLLPCSFAGIEFPILSVRVKGGHRIHVHEYPHSPGGAVEKLGRKLYEIEVVPCFAVNLIPEKYKGLWPNKLRELEAKFEHGDTEDLVLPTIGKIRACADKWERDFTPARQLYGEGVTWSFTEDQENARLVDSAIKVSQSIQSKLAAFIKEGDNLVKPSLWDQIAGTVDWVLSFKDQFELYGNLIDAKMLSLLGMFKELDNSFRELGDPRNVAAAISMHELWSEVATMYQDQKQLGRVSKAARTPKDMDIGQVSVWLYGDSTYASELLTLNAFDDPFAIPAGTVVRYYQLVEA